MIFDYKSTLEKILQEAFEKYNITTYKVCKLIGIHRSTISNIKSSRRNMTVDSLAKILSCLGYKIMIVKDTENPINVSSFFY